MNNQNDKSSQAQRLRDGDSEAAREMGKKGGQNRSNQGSGQGSSSQGGSSSGNR